jgi:hypothetical protein
MDQMILVCISNNTNIAHSMCGVFFFGGGGI